MFKLNDLGLAVGKTLKFYTRVAKRLKLKVTKLQGQIWCVLRVCLCVYEGEGLFAPLPS